ncbi:ribose 5-phosphate isomerase B [Catalinimonas alkaloidigena]|uniref:Ribose 5-phosphate isomerase B n=1 Tax=Catalinimonas alkaloidigena TaxID=1075417 RepID=A0A1G9E5F8_9BACT|nr:ribose 5-phosphate isomerase B [Catalinimonas alkaloidigena]SDK71342.1 ribose 5-phosphate isomerase B [Catalinimonas alkaloidigena]
MFTKIAIGADHAGFALKEKVVALLNERHLEVVDKGTYSEDSVDYPDFAHPVASAVEDGAVELGVLICGTGNGVAIAANKHQGIRAALCWTSEIAALTRQHNDANVLCIPARFVSEATALEMVQTFLDTAFEGGRHARRIGKIACV